MDGGEEGGVPTSQKSKFTVRTSLRAVHELLEQLDKDQRAAVVEIGFGSLLEIRCTRIHRDLCHWLSNRFDYDKCCLSVHGREIPISIKDVEIVLGVSGSGADFEANLKRSKHLSVIAKEIGFGKGDLQLKNLKARMLLAKSTCSNEDFKRCFTLYMLGTLLCPTTGLEVKSCFLWLVRDVSMIHGLNWSKFILQDLCKSFRIREKAKNKGLRGCILFLQLFYLDRVTPKTLVFEPFLGRPRPRIRFWGDAEIKNHVDALLPNSTLEDLDKDCFAVDECPTPFENSNAVHSVQPPDIHDPCLRRLNSMDLKIARLNDTLAQAMAMLSAIQSDLKDLKAGSGTEMSRDIPKESPRENRSALKTPAGKETQPKMDNSNSNRVDNTDRIAMHDSLDTLFGPNHYKGPELGPEPDPTGQFKKYQSEAKQLLRNSRCHVDGFEQVEGVMKNEQSPKIVTEMKIESCFVVIDGTTDDSKAPKGQKLKGHDVANRKGSSDVEHEAKDSSPGAVASNEAKAVIKALPPTPLQQDDSSSVLRVPQKISTRRTGEKRPSKYVSTPYVKVPPGKKNRKGNKGGKDKALQAMVPKDCGIINANSFAEDGLEDYIFNPSYPQEEIIVKIGLEHASRRSIRCLGPGSWISDSIINLVVNMLRLEPADDKDPGSNRRIWYLPTYFALKIQQDNVDYDNVSSYLAADRYGGEINTCSKVFIPLNVGNMHWYCMLIDFDAERVFILDSLASKRRHACVPRVVQAFDKMCSRVFGDGYLRTVASFAVETPKLLKQNNTHDCGVHVVKYMEAAAVDKMKDIQFDSKTERMRIARRLLMHEKNVWRFLVEGHLQRRQRC